MSREVFHIFVQLVYNISQFLTIHYLFIYIHCYARFKFVVVLDGIGAHNFCNSRSPITQKLYKQQSSSNFYTKVTMYMFMKWLPYEMILEIQGDSFVSGLKQQCHRLATSIIIGTIFEITLTSLYSEYTNCSYKITLGQNDSRRCKFIFYYYSLEPQWRATMVTNFIRWVDQTKSNIRRVDERKTSPTLT